MTPDNVCDISVNILFLQCIWQGIWNLTMYVTLEQLAFSYKDCDRVYDTWQCMWHLCNFPILTMYVTGYMIPDNVCDITENILFLTRYVTGYMTGDMTPDNVCDISVNILFRQGVWRGMWHLTMYVTDFFLKGIMSLGNHHHQHLLIAFISAPFISFTVSKFKLEQALCNFVLPFKSFF